jgi:hypothetical protein
VFHVVDDENVAFAKADHLAAHVEITFAMDSDKDF